MQPLTNFNDIKNIKYANTPQNNAETPNRCDY